MDSVLNNLLIAIGAAAIIGTVSLAFTERHSLYRAILIAWGVLSVICIIYFIGYSAGADAEHGIIRSACKTAACEQFVPLYSKGTSHGMDMILRFTMGLSLLWAVSTLPDLIAFIERKSKSSGSDA